jgi:hypothetical protein
VYSVSTPCLACLCINIDHGIGEELRAVEVGMVVGVKLNDRKGTSLRPFYRLNNNFKFILQVMHAGHGICHGIPDTRAPYSHFAVPRMIGSWVYRYSFLE